MSSILEFKVSFPILLEKYRLFLRRLKKTQEMRVFLSQKQTQDKCLFVTSNNLKSYSLSEMVLEDCDGESPLGEETEYDASPEHGS